MADNKKKSNGNNKGGNNKGGNNKGGNNDFTPTFRRYADMNEGEQDAFRQGAKTVENKVKENLGLKKPK